MSDKPPSASDLQTRVIGIVSQLVGRDLSDPKERMEFSLGWNYLQGLREIDLERTKKRRSEIRGIVVGIITVCSTGAALWFIGLFLEAFRKGGFGFLVK